MASGLVPITLRTSMVIGELALWEKTGGRSGVYRREV